MCGLRTARLPSCQPFSQSSSRRRQILLWTGGQSKALRDKSPYSSGVKRRWQTTATAVAQDGHVDRINGPSSTRPAPLVIPETNPNDNVFTRMIKRGRGCSSPHTLPSPPLFSASEHVVDWILDLDLTFYKTGLKNVWVNFRLAQSIRSRIKDAQSPSSNTPLHALPSSLVSRSDFLLLSRADEDVKRIPVFALILLVCGEFTPLVVPFISGIVPKTCRIPIQVTSERKLLEERRRQSFRDLVTPPPSQMITDPHIPNREEGGLLPSLKRDQLLHISRSLGLHSKYWPDKTLSAYLPPTPLLQRRLQKRMSYLKTDDRLIERDGDVHDLISEELHTACVERGLDTLNKNDVQLRTLLRSWLWLTMRKGSSLYPLLLTRSVAVPV